MSKLYRIPEEGMISGVCAGIARYTGIPVLMIRILAILALFMGAFIVTIVIYFALAFILDDAPAVDANYYSRAREQGYYSAKEVIQQLESDIKRSESRLRELERYVTSDTFKVESRFRRL
jgi:phage shock protein C